MKTIAKILFIISVLMISFQANARNGTTSIAISSSVITYKVIIHMQTTFPSSVRDEYVVVTNENGQLIAPAQQLLPGKNVYYFTETGPVKGVRVAMLRSGLRPQSDSIISGAVAESGIFNNGDTYVFNLWTYIPKLINTKN